MALLIDALIIVVYFAAITSIGLYMGRREKSLHDFALGGRSMPWWAVMASIIAAETSAATFLGTPGEGFANRAFWYVQLTIGLIMGRVLVGYVFLKPYYEYKVYTVYDYLGVRWTYADGTADRRRPVTRAATELRLRDHRPKIELPTKLCHGSLNHGGKQ